VTNLVGSVASNIVDLVVNVPPSIVVQPVSRTAAIESGVIFSVQASGTAPLHYQWRKAGANLVDDGRIAGSTTTTLAVANLGLSDAGDYDVLVTNMAGSATSVPATLIVVDARATHAVVGFGYFAGGTVSITQTLVYNGSCTGLGWQMLLPEGWSYVSGGGSEGDVKPSAGTTSLLEWAWTSVPASPVTFTATLAVPADQAGVKTIAALALFRVAAGPTNILAKPDPLGVEQDIVHTADTDRNFRFGLIELTRIIELYNTRNGTTRTGCYQVEAGSEDGFSPDPTRAGSAEVSLTNHHSADVDRNGKLGLLELTRMIELYNTRSGTIRTGQYHVQAGTEDGYAPGP
jgi:hypothetical protein